MTRTRLADMLTLTDDRMADTFASYRLFDGVLGERDRAALSAAGRACLAVAAKFPPQAYLAALVALVLVLTLTLLPALLPAFVTLALVAGLWGVLRAARQAMAEADAPLAGVAAPVMCYSAGQWIACYIGADVPAPAAVPVGGAIVVPAGRLAAPAAPEAPAAEAYYDATFDDGYCPECARTIATLDTTANLTPVSYAALRVRWCALRPENDVCAHCYRHLDPARRDAITVPPGKLAAPQPPPQEFLDLLATCEALAAWCGMSEEMTEDDAESEGENYAHLFRRYRAAVAKAKGQPAPRIAAAPELLAAAEEVSAWLFARARHYYDLGSDNVAADLAVRAGRLRAAARKARDDAAPSQIAVPPGRMAALYRCPRCGRESHDNGGRPVCCHCGATAPITVPPAKLAAPSDESPRWLTADLAGQRVLCCPLGHAYWRDEREAISRWTAADPHLAAFAVTLLPDSYPTYPAVKARLLAEAMALEECDQVGGRTCG